MLEHIISLLVGILAGGLGSILGVGGGVVMLPVSEHLLGLNTSMAVGTTLFAVMFTAMTGALAHYSQGNVQIKNALMLAAGGLLGVISGSYVFNRYLSQNTLWLSMLLGFLFLIMTYRMGREALANEKSDLAGQPSKYSFLILILVGIIIGLITGIAGLGGGFLMVPAMIWLTGATPFQAVGTTLLAMFPIAAVGAFTKLSQGYVDLPVALLMGTGTIVGTQIGARTIHLINQRLFRMIFTILFCFLAINYLYIGLSGL
ncbi:MAG: sulfite exporter TauE/SafE family protein [Syntrophomonadaceae bacterium]|nr:sulfite exporter TauE/SafE family protein [Syntrophomonadaceae bacterium]